MILLIIKIIILLILIKGKNMDTTRWKSVAVRIDAYNLLKAESDVTNRSPGNQMEELIKSFVEEQAKKHKKSPKVYKTELLGGKYLRQI